MRRSLLATSCVVFFPLFAHAQEIPDAGENVTVTATRVATPAQNLPAGITIIDRKTMEERGYITLVDALNAVPGLRVVQLGGPGAQASVFIRGTNSNHVLVLRDGIPINDPGDPGGAFNFGVDTLEDVARIEIVRGPMSSLYGSGAIGGVINLITKHGTAAPHGHITLAGGFPASGLAQADSAGGFGIWDYALSAQGFSDRGFDQTPRREAAAYTGEVDGGRSKLGQIELGVTPLPDTRISLLVRARDAKYGYDEEGFVVFDGGNASGYDASLFGRLGLTSQLLNGAWRTSLYLTQLQNDRNYIITLAPQDPNDATGNSRYHARRSDAQWNNTLVLPDSDMLTASSLTFGAEHISDESDTKIDTNSGGYPYNSLVRAHDDTASGDIGFQSTFETRLSLTAQLREDATTIAGNAFTWRAGGVFDLAEMFSHLKASYGTSFRAPSLYDRYGVDSYGYAGNPTLRPEYGTGFEAGIVTETPDKSASIALTYFNTHIHDLIETAYAANYLSSTPININRARTQGLETTLTFHVARWLQADLTYTYTDARDLGTGSQLLRRPYNQGSVNLRATPIPKLVITPELLYIGASQDYLTSDQGVPLPITGLSPSGLIFNLNATYQVTPKLQFFLWSKNLTASRFEPANGTQIPGMSALAGARLSF